MLEEQKDRRSCDAIDFVRKIAEDQLWDDDDMEEEGREIKQGIRDCGNRDVRIVGFDEVDCTATHTDLSQKPDAMDEGKLKKKRPNPYRNRLMLSEWMVDIPSDFEDSWLVVVCPVGKRCLVVASKGRTKAYSRTGKYIKHFPSHLPGGSHKYQEPHHHYTVLDCIFHEALHTFFVLDIMCWRGHPVCDSDTEFRSFWLHSKISEEEDRLSQQSRSNPFKFLPLQYHSCKKDDLCQLLCAGWKPEVDGLLFFHKRALYTHGMSPLSVWLKPHMVPTVLGVPVSQEFLNSTPALSCGVNTSLSVAMEDSDNH